MSFEPTVTLLVQKIAELEEKLAQVHTSTASVDISQQTAFGHVLTSSSHTSL